MRGSNDFTVMKGFLDDYTVKGDVTDKSEVDEVKASKAKTEKKEKPDKDATHMAEDLSYIEDASDKDIADGYVSDVQGDKVKKGWEAYNEACSSGVVLKDYGFDKNNVGTVIKSMEEGIVTKIAYGDSLRGAYEWNKRQAILAAKRGAKKVSNAVKDTGQAIVSTAKDTGKYATDNVKPLAIGAGVGAGAGLGAGIAGTKLLSKDDDEAITKGIKEKIVEGAKAVGRGAKAAGSKVVDAVKSPYVAIPATVIGGGAAAGALNGSAMGAAAAGPDKRLEGAKEGAKRGAIHGSYAGPQIGAITGALAGAGAGSRVARGETLEEQKARTAARPFERQPKD